MATQIGEYYYKISADGKPALTEVSKVEKGFADMTKTIKGQLANIKAGFDIVAGAISKVVQTFSKFIADAAQEAKSVLILNNALSKVGLSASVVEKQISQMAKKTSVPDDAIRQMYSYGIAIGVPADKLEKFAQASLDYSASSGKGLEMAMRTVGSAAKQGAADLDRFAQATAGAAEVAANADFGLSKASQAWGEFSETLGLTILENVSPAIVTITEWLDGLTTWLNEIRDKAKFERKNVLTSSIQQLKDERARIEAENKNIAELLAGKGGNRSELIAMRNKNNKDLEYANKLLKEANKELKEIEKSEISRYKLGSKNNTATADDIKTAVDAEKAREDMTKRILEIEKEIADTRKKGMIESIELIEAGMNIAKQFISNAMSGKAPERGSLFKDIPMFGKILEGIAQSLGFFTDAMNQRLDAAMGRVSEGFRLALERLHNKLKQTTTDFIESWIVAMQNTFNMITNARQNIADQLLATDPQAYLDMTNDLVLAESEEGWRVLKNRVQALYNLGTEMELSDEAKENIREAIQNIYDEIGETTDEGTINLLTAEAEYYLYLLDLTNEMTDTAATYTDELEKQNRLLMERQSMLIGGIQGRANAGLIDVENLADIGRIQGLLSSYGVSGGGLLDALNSIGVTGGISNQIGQINIEVNEAAGTTAEAAIQADIVNAFLR
jgi:hypothetical protein